MIANYILHHKVAKIFQCDKIFEPEEESGPALGTRCGNSKLGLRFPITPTESASTSHQQIRAPNWLRPQNLFNSYYRVNFLAGKVLI